MHFRMEGPCAIKIPFPWRNIAWWTSVNTRAMRDGGMLLPFLYISPVLVGLHQSCQICLTNSDSTRPKSVLDFLSKWHLVPPDVLKFSLTISKQIKASRKSYCGFSSGWGWLMSLSPFPCRDSVWSLLDFRIKNVNFCCFLGGIFLRCYVQPFTKSGV